MHRFGSLTIECVTPGDQSPLLAPQRIRCMLERDGCHQEILDELQSRAIESAGTPTDCRVDFVARATQAGWSTLSTWTPLCPRCVTIGVEVSIADEARSLLPSDLDERQQDDEWEICCGNCDTQLQFPTHASDHRVAAQLQLDGWMAVPRKPDLVVCPACKATLQGG